MYDVLKEEEGREERDASILMPQCTCTVTWMLTHGLSTQLIYKAEVSLCTVPYIKDVGT